MIETIGNLLCGARVAHPLLIEPGQGHCKNARSNQIFAGSVRPYGALAESTAENQFAASVVLISYCSPRWIQH